MSGRSERLLVAVDRFVLAIFFRSVELVGAERAPAAGPLVVVANHVNGLIDPMLVLAALPRVPRFLAKSTLWGNPLLRPFLSWARVIPVHRRQDAGSDPAKNAETFAVCRRVLAAGGAVALFPEGQSHDEPSLAPLKTGAARIALETEMEHGGGDGFTAVRILPLGLTFDAKDRFRSRALVRVGEPFAARAAAGPAAPAPGGGLGDGAPPEAVLALTVAVDAALAALTVNHETWEEARLVRRAAEIYGRGEQDLPRRGALAEAAALEHLFAGGYRELKASQPQAVERVAEAVRLYDRLLATARLRDRHVAARYARPPVARFVVRSLSTLLVRLPLAALGTLANAVPYQLTRLVSKLVARERDQFASWKVFPALALYPLTWFAEAVAAGWLAGRAAGAATGWGAALAVLTLAPLSGWAALRVRDRGSQLLYEARAFLVLRTRRRFAEELRAEREDVRRRVGELVELWRGASVE